MRPQQQGRRNRNRGGGRRNQNPLQRSYESNGPDVKIRGNAQVIADKYTTLARDALSSGDTVMAENYLQHAEHYNRIILAAQPQQREGEDDQDQANRGADGDNNGAQAAEGRPNNDDRQGRRRNRDDNRQANGPAQAQDGKSEPGQSDEQPVIEGTPAEVQAEQAEQGAKAEGAAEAPKRPRQRRPRKNAEASQEQPEQAEATSDDDQETPVAAE